MALVAAVKPPRRAGRADGGRIVGRRKPGILEAWTAQVRHQTRPFSPQGICLDGGEGAVSGAPSLGGQEANGTQVDPAWREGGTG